MSQIEILELIRSHPGILQQDIHKNTCMHKKGVATQVLALLRKKDIRRVPTDDRRTYELYAVE